MEGKLKFKIFILILSLLPACLLSAVDLDSADRIIPDNYEVRREFKNVIFGSGSEVENIKLLFQNPILPETCPFQCS